LVSTRDAAGVVVNETLTTEPLANVAVRDRVPITPGVVQVVDTKPFASDTADVGDTVPLPAVAAKFTVAPATAFPN
jgi:hypothetical protein